MQRIGVIGYGNRIQWMINQMRKLTDEVAVAAVCDIRQEEVRREMCDNGIDVRTHIYSDVDQMLDSQELDGVMIGTRCSTHSTLAAKVLSRNLPLFLEKPVATNLEDLVALKDAAEKSSSEVVVSFPLRVTEHVRIVKEIIDSGKIGTVEHVQAWNNVPYGWVYYQLWYRDENETQGLWVQKSTHDFDYINYILGIRPVEICAMDSRQVFKGNHRAGLMCSME
jgi:predicted dehydrogenase